MDSTEITDANTHLIDKIVEQALQWSPEEWQCKIGKLTLTQIAAVLPMATDSYDFDEWETKTIAAISGLSEKNQLEIAGQTLLLSQIKQILTAAANKENALQDKLAPLFVGMSQSVFRNIIKTAPSEQLQILKQEAVTEAIQHHLTILSHELTDEMAAYDNQLERTQQELRILPLEQLTKREVESATEAIQELYISGNHFLYEADCALAITWNANRLDLIERFSHIKEHSQNNLFHIVGSPRTADNKPTGLWDILEKRLVTVFEMNDAQGKKVALQDDEPSIEAFVKFEIWYMADYLEIGLLPDKTSLEELDLPPETYTDKERLAYRESLFSAVNKSLDCYGLRTVGDLKRAHIYSRKALKEFIEENS